MSLSVKVGVLHEVFVMKHVPVNQLPITHLCHHSPCIMYWVGTMHDFERIGKLFDDFFHVAEAYVAPELEDFKGGSSFHYEREVGAHVVKTMGEMKALQSRIACRLSL